VAGVLEESGGQKLSRQQLSRHAPALIGTLDYMAPEYHLGETPSNRSDIFSLGVIAYELLTGALPYGQGFSGPRDVSRLEYIPATTLNDAVPPWVDAALAKAVHKNPAQRTEALSELVEDLRGRTPSISTSASALCSSAIQPPSGAPSRLLCSRSTFFCCIA
jgi:serine/threonine protein kinase